MNAEVSEEIDKFTAFPRILKARLKIDNLLFGIYGAPFGFFLIYVTMLILDFFLNLPITSRTPSNPPDALRQVNKENNLKDPRNF